MYMYIHTIYIYVYRPMYMYIHETGKMLALVSCTTGGIASVNSNIFV